MNRLSWIAALAVGTTMALQAHANELAGTAWQLVEIAEMNDTTHVPDDPSKYTLAFGEDGDVSILADCNRGTGSYDIDGSQLQFGPIASTRALCPETSLSERFLAQFQWIRSFVMEDGHLFLATMADGAIIEFSPLPDAVATVYGEPVRVETADEMQQVVLTALFERYAAENGLTATDEEIDAFVARLEQGLDEEGRNAMADLTPDEREQAAAMRRRMARGMITQWKINRSLHDTYGGRIIFQQMGPEPVDAMQQFLEARRAAGDFEILDADMVDGFWRYFTDDSMHSFMERGSAEEAQAFAVPPWDPEG